MAQRTGGRVRQVPSAAAREKNQNVDADRLDHEDSGEKPIAAADRSGPQPPTPHNLAVALDSFVGRHQEIVDVSILLANWRAVTLTGTAGMGKTRLALQVATTVLDRYPDGVWFVDLAPLRDPQLVSQAFANAMSLPEQPGQALTDTLVARLQGKRSLLVVDNCEHLLVACSALATSLLRSCPGLSILSTSHERLHISGEMAWPVPSLPVPAISPEGALKAEGAPTADAVRLFCERAAAIDPGFALTPDVAPAVHEVCRRLDGIPLAIELAAARVGVLAPDEIAANLDDRFQLLAAGNLSDPPRHQTLKNALEWSYGLLSPEEGVLLGRLSVFAGGCTLDAATDVCAGGPVDGSAVFDLLASLVDKSLLLTDTNARPTRYRFLETVRHFAHDRLADSGEADALRARHARWFTGLAEEAEPELSGPDQQRWLDRLQADYDNLRAALDWATTRGQADIGLRLAGALSLFWRVRGYFSEGLFWLAAARAQGDVSPPTLRAMALWGTGFLSVMLGDHGAAVPALEESIRLFEEVGNDRGSARALLLLGNSLVFRSPEEALPVIERSVEISRRAGDTWCLSHALAVCGMGLLRMNETGSARQALEESISVARECRDVQGLRLGLAVLGQLALVQGDYREAETLLNEALGLLRQLGDTYGLAVSLESLASVALGRGEFDAAQAVYEESLSLARSTGSPTALSCALCGLGRLALARGEPPGTARRWFEEAAATYTGIGQRPPPEALFGLGIVALASGSLEQARVHFEEAADVAKSSCDQPATATALFQLAKLASAEGDHRRALTLHSEALLVRHRSRQLPRVAQSLEAMAALAVEADRHEEAARMLGAAEALRRSSGHALTDEEDSCHRTVVSGVQAALGKKAMAVAWGAGRDLSPDEAVAYATRGRGRGSRSRPETGWHALTNSERSVAALVADGLSNAEIGERLFISPRTVGSHLNRAYTKLGISTRTELAVEVLARKGT